MRLTGGLAAFPALLLCSLFLSAQSPATGTIRGKVVDATDGSGIEGTDIYLQGATIYGGRVVGTDPGGLFEFDNLAPGEYSARTYPDGYTPSTSMAISLDASANKEITIRVQRLPSGISFSGLVLDDKDKPVFGVKICVERRTFDPFGDPVFSTGASACADSDREGRYAIGHAGQGEYFLKAIPAEASSGLAPTYYPGVREARFAVPLVVGDQAETGIDIRMEREPSRMIRGEIANAGEMDKDTPVVVIASHDGQQVATAEAYQSPGSEARTFEIPNLPAGTYDIQAMGLRLPVVSPALSIADAGSLALELFGTSTPSYAGFAHVDLRGEDVSGIEIALDREARIATTILLPGQTLEAAAEAQLKEKEKNAGDSVLRLMDGVITLSGAQFYLRTSSVSPPPPRDNSVTVPSLFCRNGNSTFSMVAIPDGRDFLMAQVPRTECLLKIANLPANDFVESAKLDGEDIWDRIIVPPPSASRLMISLSAAGGQIGGRILDEHGEVFSVSSTVVLVPLLKPGDHPSADLRYQLNAKGSFSLGGVRPGSYHVLAFPGGADSTVYYNSDMLSQYELQGASVEVKAGEHYSADVVVVRLP